MKMKEFEPPGGRASLAPLSLDPPMLGHDSGSKFHLYTYHNQGVYYQLCHEFEWYINFIFPWEGMEKLYPKPIGRGV